MNSRSEYEFFIVVPPGLEALALSELRQKYSLLAKHLAWPPLEAGECSSVFGGILFRGSLETGFFLNFLLKIPTRILIRICSFKATDFSELYKRTQKQDWQRYFRQGSIDIKVASRRSRLKIKTRIEECIKDAVEDSQKKSSFRKSFLGIPQSLFVRIENDVVELSVDTSGDPLYKRGYNKWVGAAPLRETLASALFFHTTGGLAPDEVLDPMCGSGTILFEALDFFRINRNRQYSFQNFPCFAGVNFSKWPKQLMETKFTARGFDLSAEVLEIARQNNLLRENTDDDIEFSQADLKNLTINLKAPRSVLLTNPPYDRRIAADLKEIAFNLERLFKLPHISSMGLLWPKARWEERPLQDEKSTVLHIKNGGLEIGLISYAK